VGKNHPLAGLEKCDLSELGNESLILFPSETYLAKELKRRFYDLGIVPNVLIYTMNFPLISRLLSNGKEGIFLTEEVASMLTDVARIPLAEPLEISYAFIWLKKQAISRSLSKLVALIREDYPASEML